MATITSPQGSGQGKQDHQAEVVKASLLAAGGVGTTIVTVLIVSGQSGISDEVTRYAMTLVTLIATAAFLIAAIYIWPRRRNSRE